MLDTEIERERVREREREREICVSDRSGVEKIYFLRMIAVRAT